MFDLYLKQYLKKNDLQPYYRVRVEDSGGAAVDLTGATVVCTMKSAAGALKIDRQSAGVVITNAAGGEFEYRWQAGDTDTAGEYHIEFEITPVSGGKFTVPGRGEADVIVRESLDAV